MSHAPSSSAAASDDHIRSLCDRWEKAWNDHDADAVAALCSPDLVYDEPALGAVSHGRDALRDFVTVMGTNIPDFSFERVGLYAEVDRSAIITAWHLSGTVAATGRPIEFHGDDRLELDEDGLIRAYRCLYDNRYVMAQLSASAAARP